jgi:hypothetical protein
MPMLALLVAALVALWITATIAAEAVRELISIDAAPFPRWLEPAAPLKGRWLRLLLASPLLALQCCLTFAALTFVGGVGLSVVLYTFELLWRC